MVAHSLSRLLRAAGDAYADPLFVALFGTADADSIEETVDEFLGLVRRPIERAEFVLPGVGLVLGLTLVGGEAVVVKVHRWNVSPGRLDAVQAVQRHLAEAGLPAPRPLVGPTPLGTGLATVEELRPGAVADGHEPTVRRGLAAGLAEFIDAARSIDPKPPVDANFLAPSTDGALWGEPHDLRFDFAATAGGAEWIDELAADARDRLAGHGHPEVIAHLDWRVENLGFAGTDIVAIYDWDSVGSVPEAVAVGQAAAQFSTDWRRGAVTLPAVADMHAFVADYERDRGRTFDRDERRLLDAANLLLCAYGARCQHSDRSLHPELAGPPGTGWEQLLRARGATCLDGSHPPITSTAESPSR